MTINVGDLRARAQRAQHAFEEGRSRLYRSDGETRLYSDAEHEERLRGLRDARNLELDAVEGELQGAFEEARAEITHLENRDPTELLGPDELASAEGRLAFARVQAEGMRLEDLALRLEAVRAGGDAGAIFAWWLAAGNRRESILERRRQGATPPGGGRGGDQVSNFTELDEPLRRMREALDKGRTAGAIDSARERLGQIDEARQETYLSRRETTQLYDPALAVPGM